jgi:hypothetical protein
MEAHLPFEVRILADAEDPSLAADALRDGVHAGGFGFGRLERLLSETYPEDKAGRICTVLLDDSGTLRRAGE